MDGQGRRRDLRRVLRALAASAFVLLAPAAAHATIVVNDIQVTEGNGAVTATFTLTREAGLLAPVRTISFATADGSARAPADYVATSGSLTFPAPFILPETQVRRVAVTIAGDRLDEPTESLRLVIAGEEVTDGEGVATIVDDDPQPAVSVADAAPAPEGGVATFGIALSARSGRDVIVAFATADGSAAAGDDYTARAGTLTIPAGSTTAAIAVPLLGDSTDEPNETFELRLSSPGAATLGDAAGIATILDADEPAAQAPGPGAPAPAAPTVPVTGSTGVPRLGIASPRLRQPATAVITISCPADAGTCAGQLTLFTRPNKRSKLKELRRERRLGRRTFTLPSGRTATIRLTLAVADRRLLNRAGRMNVRAFVVTRDASGQTGVRTANGTLLRRTSHTSVARR